MSSVPYAKVHLNTSLLVSLLKKRGLVILDEQAAERCLARIGYHRLSAYWYPFRSFKDSEYLADSNSRAGQAKLARRAYFQAGTSFDGAYSLYVFDKRLRLLMLDALERIEIAMRIEIAEKIAARDIYGHLNGAALASHFISAHSTTDQGGGASISRHKRWLDRHAVERTRSKEDFIKHFNLKYGSSADLPVWAAAQLWDFGSLSVFYSGMLLADRDLIARRFHIPRSKVLSSWLNTLNYVRNVAAHHSRLFNKNLDVQPILPRVGEIAAFDSVLMGLGDKGAAERMCSRVFFVLCIILHVIHVLHPGSRWPVRLREHLDGFPEATGLSLQDMGFPSGWENLPLWSRTKSA